MNLRNLTIAFSLLASLSSMSQGPFDDIAHLYRLDGSEVTDEVGNSFVNNFTSSHTSEDGVVNGCHAFDYSDNISLFNFAPRSFTINFWFKTNAPQKVQRIFHRGGVGGSSWNCYSYSLVYLPGQGFRFTLGNSEGGNALLVFANPEVLDVTSWHMITCTYDSESKAAMVYIDGAMSVFGVSTQNNYAVPNYQKLIEFSRYPSGSAPQSISGNLDEIGLWTRMLSDEEVTEVYNQQGTLLGNNKLNADKGKQIGLYPNPAKNNIRFTNLEGVQQYAIHNIAGQQVVTGTITDNESVDVSMLSKGVYAISFKGVKQPIKFVKE